MRFARACGRVLADFRWVLLAAVGVLAFVFGCIGSAQYLDHVARLHELLGIPEPAPRPTDAAYVAIKLFFADGPDGPGLPVLLEIARFLSPVVAGYAALSGLAVLFRERVQQMRIPLMRGHVVVCGLGSVGGVFLRTLREAGVRVVAIELDPTNPQIEVCRNLNIPVVLGDAQVERTLHAAGVQRAGRLLAVCAEDPVNTEIVAVARRTATNRPRGELRCLAQIADPELCELLRIQEANLPEDPSSSLDFFNTDEIGARLCLDEFPLDAKDGRPHLLVSRLDGLGIWLVKHAARGWYDDRTDDSPLWVTVVDDHAEERVQELLEQNPSLEPVCRFIYARRSVREVRRLSKHHADAGAPPIGRAYVTAYRDEEALDGALALRHELDSAIPLVVVLSRARGVARLISDANASGKLTSVDMFPALERTCTMELVQGGSFGRIAKAIHGRWRDTQLAAGHSAPEWRELDESRKESSRAQARDISDKLRIIGCEIAPLRDWRASDFAFTDDELETLAVEEHDRWMAERIAGGWRPGPRDPEQKLTPYFVPFDELPKDVADLDRDAVRGMPAVLASAGFQIIRLHRSGPHTPVLANR